MNEHRHFNIGSFGGLLCVASPIFKPATEVTYT